MAQPPPRVRHVPTMLLVLAMIVLVVAVLAVAGVLESPGGAIAGAVGTLADSPDRQLVG